MTVESHASTIGEATLDFARCASLAVLEVAVGLETIHPGAMAQLNKRLDLARFDAAARFLADTAIDLRVFVLLGAPHVPAEESSSGRCARWSMRQQRGAAVVSIIPVRGGNGEMERLRALGDFTPPTLSQLEAALDSLLSLGRHRRDGGPLGHRAAAGVRRVPARADRAAAARRTLPGEREPRDLPVRCVRRAR